MYTRASIETLRKIVNIREVLCDIGGVIGSDIIDSSTELRCACPLHKGDQKTGFSWKKTEGIWSCFTKGCGELDSITRDVFGFVSLKLGISFIESIELLASKYNFTLDSSEEDSTTRTVLECAGRSRYIINQLETLRKLPGYSNNKKDLQAIIEYLGMRGYTDLKAIQNFNLYPCIDPSGRLRLGIPSYDFDGSLVGVNARRLDGIIQYHQVF